MKLKVHPQVMNKVNSFLAKEPDVVASYIFGSYSKGKGTPKSDVDMGVLCFDKSKLNQMGISLEFDKIIKSPKIDLIICDLSSDPLLLSQIINGNVFYQKSVSERSLLETRILKLIEDDGFLRKIKDYYLNKSFEEGIYADR